MAVLATISNQELRDRVAPIRDDTDNWGDTELARYWKRGVEYVQGKLRRVIEQSVLDTFNTDAGITEAFKILYGGAGAIFLWRAIRGDDDEKLTNSRAQKKEVDGLIEQIISGEYVIYDVNGNSISVDVDMPYYTQNGVEPKFRRGRYDIDGNLLDEEKDRKSTRLNSSHIPLSRMPSSA